MPPRRRTYASAHWSWHSPLCRLRRHRNTGPPPCLTALLQAGQEPNFLAAYAKHGLPRATAEHLLFPHCRQGDTKRVLSALLDFLEAAGLRHRL
ncbi:hypothetical protein MTO96_035895 [Rhipicephalus appendiculatus]